MNSERKKLPVTVLIVDDEPMILEQLGLILQRRVETLYRAANGAEALEHFNTHGIDVIISDIDMPVMNGLDLLRAVRAVDKRIPFILSTGLKSLDVLIDAIEHGITSFLPKPLKKNDLMAKIEEIAHTKELEHEVKETNVLLDQYKSIVDESIIVSKADLDGKITYVNDIFCTISGYTRDELVGQSHSIVRDPNMPSNVFAHMWETIQAKKSWQGIIHNRAKNGKRYTVKTTIAPILDNKGEISEYIALREDISDSVEKEKTIREERHKLESILNHVDDIVALVSTSEKLLFVNRKFFEIFPYKDLAEYRQRYECICDLFEQREGYLQPTMDGVYWTEYILEHPEMIHHILMIDKHGHERKFIISIQPIKLETRQFVVTMSDVTELQKAKEEANAAAKMKGEFLANMSHEIRTPMNGILGFTSLLAQSGLNEQQKKYLDIISTSTQSLLGIINDVLDFSKLESGKFELDMSAANPHIEFDKICRIFSPQMAEKKIVFDIMIDPQVSECIEIDLLRMQQITSNLLSNAAKFTHENGAVTFYVRRIQQKEQKEKIRIGVIDTGIGISPDHKEKIFSAFSQADSSTTRKFGGTGLGLSISSHLVSLMGGTLSVESEEGKGSEFYFDIDVRTCMPEHPLFSYFTHRKITMVQSISQQSDQQRVSSYFDKLRIPYSLKTAMEVMNSAQDGVICILFGDAKQSLVDRLNAQHIMTILVADEMRSDHVTGSTVQIYGLEHNMSALYNVLLSMVEKEAMEIAGSSNSGAELHFSGKVLVAEDNIVNQILIKEYLDQYGIVPEIVENGQIAVERLEAEPFDLVFMDVNMPILSGLDALGVVRAKNIDVPIVALTANAMEGDSERFLNAGFDHYLAKPIMIDAFESILKSYLANVSSAVSSKSSSKVDSSRKMSIDMARMKQDLQLPEEILRKLLNAFAESFESSYRALEDAIGERDLQKIENSAHYIKGSAANLRIHNLEGLATEIEVLAKLRAADECAEVFAQVKELKKTLLNELKEVLEQ